MACLAGPSFHEANGSAACPLVATRTTRQASETVIMFFWCVVFIVLNFLVCRFLNLCEDHRLLQNWPQHRNGVIPKPASYRPLGHRLGRDGMGAGKIGVLTAAHFGS